MIQSIEEGSTKPVFGIQDGDHPIAWASDSQHLFMQAVNATGLSIYKVDLASGRRELWQIVRPKDQVGLRPMISPIAITPDGRRIAFTYSMQLGQLYRSDTLK
jgi:Tol biopolymer transport system component